MYLIIRVLLLNMVFVLSVFAGEIEVIKDVVYGKGGDEELKLDIVKPKDKQPRPMPAIVFMHGGGWSSGWGDKKNGVFYLTDLAKRGYFGVTINYRTTPKNKFPAQIEDCKCAVRFLRAHAKEYNIDPDHIAAWGGSAGGHLASLLGTAGEVKEFEGKGGWEGYSSKVQAAISYSGVTDFCKWKIQNNPNNTIKKLIGGDTEEFKDAMNKASPITYISKNTPPFLIVHGDKDPDVSIKQSLGFSEALKAAGVEVEVYTIKDGEHGQGGEWDAFYAGQGKTIGDFLDKHFKK